MYVTKAAYLLKGSVNSQNNKPYLSLTGTSMASPVVAGTVALMLQANPALTPNLVKAILQFTAETRAGYNPLTQGAGFLNARGAVELAQSMAASNLAGGPALARNTGPSTIGQDRAPWSRHVIWGNRIIAGGQLSAAANAWRTDVTWGSGQTSDGTPIVLGTIPGVETGPATAANFVWGASCGESDPSTALGAGCDNVVWGTACGGDDCAPSTPLGANASARPGVRPSTSLGAGTIVWGTNVLDETDNVVWGASAIRRRSRMPVTEAARR
jgi:subtilisin family serine protease